MPDPSPPPKSSDSAGTIRLAVQVSNTGSVEAPAGAVVRLLTWSDANGLREVDITTLAAPLAPGQSAEGVAFDVPVSAWGTRRVVEVVGQGGSAADECDWLNNRDELEIPDPCG